MFPYLKKPSAYNDSSSVNTARGAICNAEDVAAAVKSGQLRGYAGDVWNKQPAPKDHPWRYMKNPLGGGNGMVPHYSGTTLDAQKRYADGTRKILENYFNNKPQEPANIIIGKSTLHSTIVAILRTDLLSTEGYETKAYGQR